jgi:hypothetical protein
MMAQIRRRNIDGTGEAQSASELIPYTAAAHCS